MAEWSAKGSRCRPETAGSLVPAVAVVKVRSEADPGNLSPAGDREIHADPNVNTSAVNKGQRRIVEIQCLLCWTLFGWPAG